MNISKELSKQMEAAFRQLLPAHTHKQQSYEGFFWSYLPFYLDGMDDQEVEKIFNLYPKYGAELFQRYQKVKYGTKWVDDQELVNILTRCLKLIDTFAQIDSEFREQNQYFLEGDYKKLESVEVLPDSQRGLIKSHGMMRSAFARNVDCMLYGIQYSKAVYGLADEYTTLMEWAAEYTHWAPIASYCLADFLQESYPEHQLDFDCICDLWMSRNALKFTSIETESGNHIIYCKSTLPPEGNP